MPVKNDNIGLITCPLCRKAGADVRMSIKAKFYFYCDNCGLIQPTLDGGQQFIKANAKPLPGKENYFNVEVKKETSKPEPVQVPEPEPVEVPEPEPVSKPGFLDRPLFGGE